MAFRILGIGHQEPQAYAGIVCNQQISPEYEANNRMTAAM